MGQKFAHRSIRVGSGQRLTSGPPDEAGGSGGAADSSLARGLQSWWQLEEESGQRSDIYNSRHLLPFGSGTVVRTSGNGYGALLVKASGQYLRWSATGGAVQPATPISLYAMVKFVTLPGDIGDTMTIFALATGATGTSEFVGLRLEYNGGAWKIALRCGSSVIYSAAIDAGNLAHKVYVISACVSQGDLTLWVGGMNFDPFNFGPFPNLKTTGVNLTVTAFDQFPDVWIGNGPGESDTLDAAVFNAGFWLGRVFTDDEATYLYQDGSGRGVPIPPASWRALASDLWAYYKMDEDEEAILFSDATGLAHHLTAPGNTPTTTTGIITPLAQEFVAPNEILRSIARTMNTTADKWSVWAWIYLETPSATGIIWEWADVDDPTYSVLKWTWASGTLTFIGQVGHYADGFSHPLQVSIALPGLTAPLNTKYFVALAKDLPSAATYPVTQSYLTLRVDATEKRIPTLATAAVVPPIGHFRQTKYTYVGPMDGVIGLIATYENRALTTTQTVGANSDLAQLYANGVGLPLLQ